jgi:tetratricopeptide (TPR) repeat protein
MKAVKSLFTLLSSFAVLAFFLTITGCSSPELTTGKLAFNNKDYAKAEEELRIGLEIDKSDPEGWYMLGVSQIEINKFNEAKSSFETSHKLSDAFDLNRLSYWGLKINSSINYYKAGLDGLRKNDTSTANPNLRKAVLDGTAAISILPDSLEAYRVLGDSYFYLKDYDNAIANYGFAYNKSHDKKDASDLAKAYYDKGLIYRQAENYQDAMVWFKKAVDLPELPKDNDYYKFSAFNMGIANYQIASKIATDNSGDFKPYLQTAVSYLEPLTTMANPDKTFLKDVYEFLINAYDALGDDAKKADATNKRNAL